MTALVPVMHGLIDRRMLVNYLVRPEVVREILPPFFRPKLVHGWAVVGICLIRLKQIRPRGFPAALGISSENAAHRIAVEWDEKGETCEGVFIPRRDTSSALQALVGGRGFPGRHNHARFHVAETEGDFNLRMNSRDGSASVKLHARVTSQFRAGSIFASLAEASEFFARGAVGYSATETPNWWDGIELCTEGWSVEPLEVLAVKSSFFDDETIFPKGTIEFDCALLMRNIPHKWRVLPQIKL